MVPISCTPLLDMITSKRHKADSSFPTDLKNPALYQFPPPGLSMQQYEEVYKYSLENNNYFWLSAALQFLAWTKEPTSSLTGSFSDDPINIKWFEDGELNACFNAVDRHAALYPDKVAFIYEADEPNNGYTLTFKQLKEKVCQLSNYLSGLSCFADSPFVTIYMPMVPEAIIAMLACARLGLVHNVVFGGFSSESLKERIVDTKSCVLITSDMGLRGGKQIPLLNTALEGLKDLDFVKHVLVFERSHGALRHQFSSPLINYWKDSVDPMSTSCDYKTVSSEHPLFTLYTSGSTGKPKGILHTTAGFLLYSLLTFRYVFGINSSDIFGCFADIGWITGHTYVLYGPLLNGVTSTIFESVPSYPTMSRYWEVIERFKITHLYTAPTVLRSLQAQGDKFLEGFDRSSLRVLGSVGEPIHPTTYMWYKEVVGQNKCAIVDTYWQTETGGIVISPLSPPIIDNIQNPDINDATPSVIPMPTSPGSASLPFFGIEPSLIDPNSGNLISIRYNDDSHKSTEEATGHLVFKKPWPGIARSIHGNHARYLAAYFSQYPGYYFTGDGAYCDQKGLFHLTGRVDDILNVSGHRLSTAEIEAALLKHPKVTEAAVLGQEDAITGQAICAFVILSNSSDLLSSNSSDMRSQLQVELKKTVRQVIGPIATPKRIIFVAELPKTRSGKIMRRILRTMITPNISLEDVYSALGDLSTIQSPDIIKDIYNNIIQQS